MTLTDEQIEKAAIKAVATYYDEENELQNWHSLHPASQEDWLDAIRAALEAVMPGEPVAWGEIVNIASRAKHNGDCGGGYNFVGKDAAASALMELRASGYEIVKAAPARPAPEPGELERLREAHKAAVEIAETIYYNPAGSLWNHGTTPTAKDRAEWKGARDAALEILQCLDPDRARAALGEGGGDE